MSIEGLIVALILLAVAVLWISGPLFRRDAAPDSENALRQKQVERLAVHYERTLTNIRDLDEDHATGKIGTSSYEVEREEWLQRGIQILKTLDSLGINQMPVLDEAAIDEALDDEIEAAIAAYRGKSRVNEPE